MRVCLVTTSFPRWPGDPRQLSMLETARALRDQGNQVQVIAIHAPGSLPHETLEGIKVFRPRYMWPERFEILQSEGGGLPAVWRKSKIARLEFPLAALAQAWAVARNGRECDIIHAHWTLSALAAWLTRLFHRRPYVVTVHGSDIFQGARIPLVGLLTALALKGASRVVAVSKSLADTTIELGVPASNVEVIPDGIDIARFQPGLDEREPLILFVGSLIERKGVKYLIEAMPRIQDRLPGYHLAIVGEGPQREELELLIKQLGLEESIVLVGAQSQDLVVEWMRRARLFVLPSLEEALGIVLLEALASGTPCVGTRVGGIPEVITTEVGRLVAPADSRALADAIGTLLENRRTWEQASRAARKRAEDYCLSWKEVACRLGDIYQSVLEGRRKKGEP